MKQNEIVLYLKQRREKGDDKYYSLKELYDIFLKEEERDPGDTGAFRRKLRMLIKYDFLEVQRPFGWVAYVRFKYPNGKRKY